MVIPSNLLEDLYSRRTIKPGLQRIKKLLKEFSVSRVPFSVIHIAGTNGKGSTAMMTSDILKKYGKKTGLFVSPHLIRINERIAVNGRCILDKEFVFYEKRIKSVLQKKNPKLLRETTFFEYLTLLSVLYFIDKKIEWAVYETGMGGRLDATNIFPSKVCVITDVSKEHTEFLGKTIKKIALEKFAIIKKGSRTITGVAQKLLKDTLKTLSKSDYPAFLLKKDFFVHVKRKNGFSQKLHYKDAANGVDLDYTINTPLGVQRNNSALAIKTSYEALRSNIDKKKFASVCKKAILNVNIPGRFQVLRKDPCIVVDVSHNPASIAALVETILHLDIKREWCIIFGVLKDKKYKDMFSELKKLSGDFIFLRPESERAMETTELIKALKGRIKGCRIEEAGSIYDAVGLWRKKMKNKSCLVCGSFFVAGPALKIFNRGL